MKNRTALLLLLGAVTLAACSAGSSTDPLSVSAEASESDPEFEAAVQRAHETIEDFFAAYFSPSPTQKFSGLRVRFRSPDSDDIEYHWTEFVDHYNDIYVVKLLDGLTLDMGLHTGRGIEVPASDVIDWIVVEQDGTFQGGYTVRLAYERMTPAERRKFIEVTGYVFD